MAQPQCLFKGPRACQRDIRWHKFSLGKTQRAPLISLTSLLQATIGMPTNIIRESNCRGRTVSVHTRTGDGEPGADMCLGLIFQPPGMVGKKWFAFLIILCGVGWMHHAGRAQITQVRPMPPHNRCFNNMKTPRCNGHAASLLADIAHGQEDRQQEEEKKKE